MPSPRRLRPGTPRRRSRGAARARHPRSEIAVRRLRSPDARPGATASTPSPDIRAPRAACSSTSTSRKARAQATSRAWVRSRVLTNPESPDATPIRRAPSQTDARRSEPHVAQCRLACGNDRNACDLFRNPVTTHTRDEVAPRRLATETRIFRIAGLLRCRRRDSNPRHVDYDWRVGRRLRGGRSWFHRVRSSTAESDLTTRGHGRGHHFSSCGGGEMLHRRRRHRQVQRAR